MHFGLKVDTEIPFLFLEKVVEKTVLPQGLIGSWSGAFDQSHGHPQQMEFVKLSKIVKFVCFVSGEETFIVPKMMKIENCVSVHE